MSDQGKELNIDVGGGKQAEFFFKLARENPNNTYLVLEPHLEDVKSNLPNLFLINWEQSAKSHLPIKAESVDHVHLNFLYSNLVWKDVKEKESVEEDRYLFDELVREVKRVIRPNGILHITDSADNFAEILGILEKEGFEMIFKPRPVKDTDKTKVTQITADLALSHSSITPLEVNAKLRQTN